MENPLEDHHHSHHHLNASQMLQFALQKMDGIITAADGPTPVYHQNDNGHVVNNGNNKQDKLNRLLQELKDYSNQDLDDDSSSDERRKLRIDDKNSNTITMNNGRKATAVNVSNNNNQQQQNPPGSPDHIQMERPSFSRQHSMEKSQEQQFTQNDTSSSMPKDEFQKTEKIIQLESVVNILRNQLLNTEELFKKALMSKKNLETANCDLLSIVDKLKLDLIHLESQQKIQKEQVAKIEGEIEMLNNRLLERDTEISSLRLTMAKIVRATGYVLSGNELALLRGKTITSDFIKNKYKEAYPGTGDYGPYGRGQYYYSEPSSRRESVANRMSPMAVASPGNRYAPAASPEQSRITVPPAPPMPMPSSSMLRSTSFEDVKVDSQHQNADDDDDIPPSQRETPIKSNKHFAKNAFATLPSQSRILRQIQQKQFQDDLMMGRPSPAAPDDSVDYDFRHQPPRAISTPNSPMINLKQPTSATTLTPSHQAPNVTFGRRFFWLRKNKRAASAPELAQDDEIIPEMAGATSTMARNSPRINLDDTKRKGLKRIFSRKRSTSSLAGISDAFSRGGLRATSGPRLGFNSQEKRLQTIMNTPFNQWNTNLVADWFALIGLGMYVNDCKRWCKNGEHLMRATSYEVERELGIKNPLHRKKLRLAVASLNDEEDELLKNAGRLDYLWVARWLDDIGLPQYKESFIDARVDGRVLHYLTVDDLLHLKVNSQLHFASIRSAIRVLRENNYNGQCLKRRAALEEAQKTEWSAAEVSVWSSHRIMEWLRSIDLSEYAPNLRGSGVHGALILYENAFNADLFATLLSIPTNKTLLRRHISSKFKQLIGEELNKAKLEYECSPGYQPMIPGSKIKTPKRGPFSLGRKKRTDYELTDYVCPMIPIAPTIATLKVDPVVKKEDSPASSKSSETLKEEARSLKSETKSAPEESADITTDQADKEKNVEIKTEPEPEPKENGAKDQKAEDNSETEPEVPSVVSQEE